MSPEASVVMPVHVLTPRSPGWSAPACRAALVSRNAALIAPLKLPAQLATRPASPPWAGPPLARTARHGDLSEDAVCGKRRTAGATVDPARGVDRARPPALAPGFTQANLVVAAARPAFDFLLFCQRNPKPCPLLDVTEPGSPSRADRARARTCAPTCPRYRVYRDGELVDEPADVRDDWRDDLVGFLIGCSFTFESALLARPGCRCATSSRACNVPMYRTTVACRPAGRFAGPLVVSMRPMTPAQAIRATQVTRPLPARPRRAGPRRRPGGARHRATSPRPTSATRWRSAPARCRCSGPAA